MRAFLFIVAAALLAGCAAGNQMSPPTSQTQSAARTGVHKAIMQQAVADDSSYGGCKVYPDNDWFTTNLVTGGSSYVSNAVDPNSANIIAHLSNTFPGLYIDEANPGAEVTVNLANSGTPTTSVNGTTLVNDPYDDDPNNVIPVPNPFFEAGSAFGNCSGDCHAIVLNTQTCVDYETYGWGSTPWHGGVFRAGGGGVHNLNNPLNNQYARDVGITAASLPLLGMTDFGEDASASSINHIIDISMPGSGAFPNATGNYVAPAVSWHPCATNCSNELPLGARLRLKSSYQCPSQSDYPQSYLVCNQLKTYGAIFVDWNGSGGYGTSTMLLRFGTSSDGSNPWNRNDLYGGLRGITINDFDVMTLGAIH